MSDLEQLLSQELARIIACPYPASLTKLADILARADHRAVRACISDRPPCAISRLADIVCQALPLWAYSYRILQALCHSLEFRHALLLQNPGILDALLTKADSSEREFDEYGSLCVLLLSRPLPEVVPLPASAQSFFLHVFDRAVQAPGVDTLKPIYDMLNGACKGLLGLLSPEAKHAFDKEICSILSSNSTGQNSMLLLWCFGIVILAEYPQDVGSICVPTHHPSQETSGRQWKTASGRKLFGSSAGLHKTINLTYLSVIWALKSDVGVSEAEAMEGIRIAIRTMLFIDQEVRESWPESGTLARNTFPKLPAKILRKGIHAGVQLEALCFYAMIAGEESLSTEVIAQYEAALSDICELRIDTVDLREVLSISLPAFSRRLHNSTIHQLLARILDNSIESGLLHELSSVSILVEQLTVVLPSCEQLRSQILVAASSNELQQRFQSFLQSSTARQLEDLADTDCHKSIQSLQRELHSATISMLLTSAMIAPSTEPRLSQPLAIALISMQQRLVHSPCRCNHPTSGAQSAISLFEQECTPTIRPYQQNWRDRLQNDLEMHSVYQRESVIRSVSLICQDLENRCDNVEKPLRQEQERTRDLLAHVSQLREQVHSLETETMDRRLYSDGLEAEINNAEVEKEEIALKLSDLRTEFANANRRADETLRLVQEDFTTRELIFQSTILTNEQALDTCDKKIRELNEEIKELHENHQKGNTEKLVLRETHERLKATHSTVEAHLEAERRSVAQQEEDISRLKDVSNALESQLAHVREELDIVIKQRSEFQVRHDELMRSSELAVRELGEKYENDMHIATVKANDKYNQLDARLQAALQKCRLTMSAYEDACRERELVQATVRSLGEKVESLTDACSERDEELHELRSFKRNIIATVQPQTRSSSHVESQLHLLKNPQLQHQQHRRRKSTIWPNEMASPKGTMNTEGITNTAIENVANASFTSSDSSSKHGSTPKRPKPRPSFKAPSINTPIGEQATLSSTSPAKKLSPTKRQALAAISPNRRQTTTGFAVPESEKYDNRTFIAKQRGSQCPVEQTSFDMDALLTGTPFTPINVVCGTGRAPVDEEETTEL